VKCEGWSGGGARKSRTEVAVHQASLAQFTHGSFPFFGNPSLGAKSSSALKMNVNVSE